MKPKLLTSIIFGVLLPWLYFAVVTVSPVRYASIDGKTNIGKSGVSGFIEFHGVTGATAIYIQSALLCGVFVFIVCSVYAYIEGHYATKA